MAAQPSGHPKLSGPSYCPRSTSPVPRPRFCPSRYRICPALSIRPGDSYCRIFEAAQPVGVGGSVVVEQGNPIGARRGNSLVVGAAKSPIAAVPDQTDGGKLRRHQFWGSVLGAVIDHDDFGRKGRAGVSDLFFNGYETFPQELATIPVDDNHSYQGYWVFG